MTALADLGLVDAADAVARREVSLGRACWRPAWPGSTSVNKTINATIWVERDRARAAARAADAALAAGKPAGRLHGIPLAHKDMYYQAGLPCTCGSAIRRDFVPDITCTVVERLSAAGAYSFAGLNMAEFAQNPTGHNRAFGDCHNPWNPPYITGGSSSGSGASVASGVTYASLGSDTGGSIRLPASACGVTGIKPTQTRVSRYGVMPLSFSADNVGPLARSARDCARILSVIAGADPRDPTSASEPVPDYEAALTGDLRGVRIGVPTNAFTTIAEPPVLAALEAALKVLEGRGAAIVRLDVPLMKAISAYVAVISRAEGAAIHAQWMRERAADYAVHLSARLYGGYAIPAAYYVEALACRGPILKAFAGGGVQQGRPSGHAHHPHVPAHARRDGHRPRPAGHRAEVHGGLHQHAAVQLPRPARRQCALRARSERPAHRAPDRRPPLRRGARAPGRRRLPARYRLAPPPPAGGAGVSP